MRLSYDPRSADKKYFFRRSEVPKSMPTASKPKLYFGMKYDADGRQCRCGERDYVSVEKLTLLHTGK